LPESKQSKKEKAAAAKARAAERARLHRQKLKNSRTGRQFGDFVEFIRQQGVVGLAIGLVLGLQVKALVDQFVASFVNPLLGLVLPGSGSLASKTFTLNVSGKSATFGYGKFIDVLLSFVIVAAVVYMVFKVLRLEKLDKKKE
jgi:large conductance mechanosensitive channel